MSLSYIEANKKGRERLCALVCRLTDEELELQAYDGWTVAAILAHLAFWDNRVLELIRRWKKVGVGRSPIDMDNVNDAMKPLCLAIPAREAAILAVGTAEAVDAELENLPEDLIPGIYELMRKGKFRLDRSFHRHEHLDQIDQIIAEIHRWKAEQANMDDV